MSKGSVSVRIAGQEYRIRSDADQAWLQKVAGQVDATMQKIRQRTGTVDSLDVALLTALNLARELMTLRQSGTPEGGAGGRRLRALIERAESAVIEQEALGSGAS